MQCNQCQHENPEGAKFCNECATPLIPRCLACGTENPVGAKFCHQCATSLSSQTTPSDPDPRPVQEAPEESSTTCIETFSTSTLTPDAERRQLTVMFCDLVESTALSGRLDPEELREIVRAYQAACTEVIQRFDGHVAQLLGDGLLVYFGYPQAHEDDAQRAVRAGLGMLESMGTLNSRLEREHRVWLAIRVGIHTGRVVVGEMGGAGRQEQLALGETPNVAARVQGVAEPNTVVMSEATAELVQGYFNCQALGAHHLRGVSQPINVYHVLQESGAQSRLDVATLRGLTPLVGRESEVTLLVDRWGQVQDGLGHVVLLSGEAGIGKSRLVQVLKDHIATVPHTRLECRSSPYYQNTALYPITDLLQRALAWGPGDTTEAKWHKLEHALGGYDLGLETAVPLFAALLSLPLPEDRYRPLDLTPQQIRQQTLETLVAMLTEESERQPLLFIVEDLHWTDPTTLELLDLLIDQSATAAMLTLLTCRPEFQPSWSHRSHLAEVSLSRLSHRQMEWMAERVAKGKRLPEEVLQEIVEKTDGVPLFVEEIVKAVVESGVLQEHEDHYEVTGSVASLTIPTTLHDSLMSRLDRLASAKEVAQIGSVVGRQFSYALLHAVLDLDEARLQHDLERLVEVELVYQRGLPPQATYLFKHALVQDTAYESLLRSTRQGYHRRIAEVLEERFPETVEAQPELVAHHYSEAGCTQQAIGYWQRAGQRASEHSAYQEAMSHLTTGLTLLQSLPETRARHRQELSLQTALGSALLMVRGHAAPEVEAAYRRARLLCQQLGDTQDVFPILWGQFRFYVVRPDLPRARQLGEDLLGLAERRDETPLYVVAHQALGGACFWMGELLPARHHLEEGITRDTPVQRRSALFRVGQDPGVACYVFVAYTLWLLGYPDQALARAQEGLALAVELDHPFSRAFALHGMARVEQFRREGQDVYDHAEAAMTLSTEQGFTLWLAISTFFQGWALMTRGQGEEGLIQMCQGLTDWRASGAELSVPYFLTFLAEGYGNLDQVEAGLDTLKEGWELMERTGEDWWKAEVYRLQGALLLQQASPDVAQAETCFHQALDMARRQQAKSLELRAAMSLARLWQQQDKRQEVYDLLAPVYEWFTEGFDTADLQDAKTLLNELER